MTMTYGLYSTLIFPVKGAWVTVQVAGQKVEGEEFLVVKT